MDRKGWEQEQIDIKRQVDLDGEEEEGRIYNIYLRKNSILNNLWSNPKYKEQQISDYNDPPNNNNNNNNPNDNN